MIEIKHIRNKKLDFTKIMHTDYELLNGCELVHINATVDYSSSTIKVLFKVEIETADNKDNVYECQDKFDYLDCARYLNLRVVKDIDITE
jgi:hypothetical protein